MTETITMWRPVGPDELALVKGSQMRRWPPRLEWQPIFYPVTNEWYATEITRMWNVPECGVGYVTKFEVDADFAARYEVHCVGAPHATEWLIPAEELDALNDAIVGEIEVVGEYR